MPVAPELARLRSELGGYVRRHNHEAADQARRALALAVTEHTIRRAIETAPPLDPDTLDRIRSLIPAVPAIGGVGDGT
ncbi:MAG: hypothetical protein GEV12_08630 [Micromonosporaceae bacterium]|nr:hypothetical protein [Micromonosporaceae bacterium]